MIPIKIQCDCGQRYAFDAEPVDGRMAAPVNCPACGTEGTTAANEIIARTITGQPPAPAPTRIRLNLAAAEPAATPASRPPNAMPASAPHASQLGLVDRHQAEIEARAKVSWGDPPENVLKYLMIQRFTHEEASALVTVLYQERAVTVRAKGVKKIVIGILMIIGAAAGILWMLSLKFLDAKLVGGMLALALWGLWLIINGGIMVVAPKMQSGDVAES